MEIPAFIVIILLLFVLVWLPFRWVDQHHMANSCNSVCLGLFGVVIFLVFVVAVIMRDNSKQ